MKIAVDNLQPSGMQFLFLGDAMKWATIFLLSLAACGETVQEREFDKTAKMLGVTDNASEVDFEIPNAPLKCIFATRAYCVGAECRQLEAKPPPMYVIIDKPSMTYKRCGPKPGDCQSYEIDNISPGPGYQNVVSAAHGFLFKFGPTGSFTDIVTQGPQTFISDGKCERI